MRRNLCGIPIRERERESESEEREVERSKEQKEKVFRKSEKKIPQWDACQRRLWPSVSDGAIVSV